MHELSIVVREMAGVERVRPVTGGVPLARGAAADGCAFRLQDGQGSAVPVQTEVLARWEDGSARWVLLDFQASPPARGEARYTLTWADPPGAPADECAPREPALLAGSPALLQSGAVSIARGEGEAALRISQALDLLFTLVDAEGNACLATTESVEALAGGPVRAAVELRGSFRRPSGERVFQFRLRASLFAGLSLVKLEPFILVDADSGVLQRIRSLSLSLRPRGGMPEARIGAADGEWHGSTESPVRLFQYDDQSYRFEGAAGEGDRAPGWAETGGAAVALRDFRQQWPKSIDASADGLSIGLFPAFREGDYAEAGPWYKHQYLFEGDCYRLRTGQARRWEVWLDLAGDGPALSRIASAPLVPAADPAQAIATGVWDAIVPAGTPASADYDPWAEQLFAAYCESIETQRDYGAMNWGDWFGERQVNWGNHEYDTANQLLIQFARTGDPRYFYVADAAARHSSEVDVVHFVNADLGRYFTENWPVKGYPPRPGMVHEHTVGHVSGFYPVETIRDLFLEKRVGGTDNPYLCLDPFNLGHIWTQGLARHYFLTGDPFLKETVERIGDNLARLVEDGEYTFAIDDPHSGRAIGWPLLALAGAYELGGGERTLRAMKELVDRMLARQDPVCGGWLYQLYPGHCWCTTRKHVGMAGFITAVLVNGMSHYYLLTGDDRLPKALERAVTFLDNDTWREEWRDWRYTSCPATAATHQPGVVIMAHVNAVRIAGSEEHLRVLRVAWEAKFRRLLAEPRSAGMGKTYTATMYGCAEAAGLLGQAKEAARERRRTKG